MRSPQELIRTIYTQQAEEATLAAVELAQRYECETVTELVTLLYPEGDIPTETFNVISDAIHAKEKP